MSRRDKARARAKEILRRRKPEQHDTSHLDALRAVPDEVTVLLAAEQARVETPVFAEVIRHVGLVPEPPCTWEQGTTLLPLARRYEVTESGPELVAEVSDDAALVGA